MVNVWYDFNEGSRWRPFIGGGLGFVQVDWGGVDYQRGALEQHNATRLRSSLRASKQAYLREAPMIHLGFVNLSWTTCPVCLCPAFRHRYGVRL